MAEQPRTMFAQKALDFAQLFAISFAETPVVSGKTSYKLEISSPEGPSTGGGLQGVQHITLVPQGGGTSVVVGSANRTSMTVQLRNFELLQQIHDRRAPGTSFALDAQVYGELLKRLDEFFSNQTMKVTRERAAPGAAPATVPAASKPFPMALVLAATAALLALGVAFWFVSTHGH